MARNYFIAGLMGLALMASTAHASVITGPYISLGAGADLTQTQHARSLGNSSQVGHAPGFGGNLGFGYGFGNGLRVELEGLYLQSHVNRVSPENAHGHNQSFGGMLNVLYDIDLNRNFGIDSPVTPYVGVGAGYLVDRYTVRSPIHDIQGTQGGFGYQGIAGVAYDVPSVPGLRATVDYRMIGQTESRASYHVNDTHFDHKFNHTFNVGLQYAFNTPAAPAKAEVSVAPPAPTPARTYIVFFDWDSSKLVNHSKEIVDRAAEASTHVQTTRIEVNGYTDTSSARGGSAGQKYNKALSLKRANAVADELVLRGVSPTSISINGYGETNLLVPTGPNVRKPENRRVEIILK